MSEKAAAEKASDRTVAEKVSDKIVEKRRALGRGLDSLLPGPRVVPASSAAAQSVPKGGIAGQGPAASLGAEREWAAAGVGQSAALDSGRAGIPVAAPIGVVDLQAKAAGPTADGEDVVPLAIDLIDENPHQTRRDFNEATLKELADSIRVQGVLQPIVVREGKEGRFRLILGERRLRASRLAGLETIRAMVRRVSEQQAAEMTLVENLQRQDLNCVEQAEAFSNLSKEFKITQEEIGARVGVSRETVANYMRLLILPEGVIGALQEGKLTYSHARALLQLRDNVQIWTLAKRAMEEKMSVAKLEELVLGVIGPPRMGEAKKGPGARWMDPNVKAAQRSLETILGTRVRISDRNGKGKIVIEYGTLEDFDRVVGMLRGK